MLWFADKAAKVVAEIHKARHNQSAIFGDYDYPDGTDDDEWGDLATAKFDANLKSHMDGNLTFADLLAGELYEVLAETNPAILREGLLNVAAMSVRWIEALDRRSN